jgi:murein DD-endopeptidase MepM/ murein hydrolase activator NlpD
LLFGIIFSFILPGLDFSASSILVNSQNQFEFNEYMQIGSTISSFKEQAVKSISHPNYLLLLYCIIGCLFFVRIVYQLFKIIKTVNANEIIKYRNKHLVLMNNNSSPFSFYNYIFISKEDYGTIGSNELLLHEFTHARQMHSIDVILLELILVLQWFNPFIYRYRLAFKEVHEYLADRGVLMAKNDKIAYQKLILDQIEKSFSVNLASQFNYSLTKNRIKMMTRIKSGKLSKFKTLLVLPLVAILLMAFSINTSKEININTLQTISQTNSIPSIFPVKKVDGVKISSGFGMRIHPISKKEMMHNAVDIKAPEGTPVYATADGLVRKVKLNHVEGKAYGRYIVIDHEDGYSTLYSQLSKYNVKEGKEVKRGDVIGYVGSSGISTGPHLHYEVMKDGENVDPAKYF